jgi:Fe-S cluster assembly ATP-binding protein
MLKKGLFIKNLCISIGAREVVKGLSLDVPAGEVHAIMGPNGTGKSTLVQALAGHEAYSVTAGEAFVDGVNILDKTPDARARAGLFVAFQYPTDVPGVSLANFIRAALTSRLDDKASFSVTDYYKKLRAAMEKLGIAESFSTRAVNDGFSGGEKKRCEVLQMMMLQPTVAILDETDSGLDIDALKIVAAGVNALRNPNRAMLVITHYERLLDYIVPDRVHVMVDGRIVKSGDRTLSRTLEATGYDALRKE